MPAPRPHLLPTVALAALAALVGLTGAAPASAAAAQRPVAASPAATPGAVFVQLNGPDGNEVAAFDRAVDGTLVATGRYPTGGDGGIAASAPFDALASQGSLVLTDDGRTLLAVNAGSGSVSTFAARGSALDLVDVQPSGGLFPVSVTAERSLVYVLDAGGSGSVSGFRLRDGALTPVPGSTRDLGLANTPVPFFLTAPGQVGLTPDGRHLLVTTKGRGVLLSFDVARDGTLSAAPQVVASPGPVPFSFDVDRQGRVQVTQAGTGGLETYAYDRSGALVLLGTSASGGGQALCWNIVVGSTVFGANAGSDTLSSWDVGRGVPALLEPVAAVTGAAPIDLSASRDGRFLYVLDAVSGDVAGYAVAHDGSLAPVSRTPGLPVFVPGVSGVEGIASR